MKRYLLEQDLLGLVERAFQAAHWQVRPSSRHVYEGLSSADRELIDPHRAYWSLILRAEPGRARGPELWERFAAALLEAHAFARRESEGASRQGRPQRALALVGAPKLSKRLCDRLAGQARSFAPPGTAWGLVDLTGIRRLDGEGLDEVERIARQQTVTPPPTESATRSSPFTDLGQWLLKVVLGPRLPEGWIHVPRDVVPQEPNRVVGLALRAEVSITTVSKLSRALGKRGFTRSGTKGIELVRLGELFEEWFRVVASQPVIERQAKFMFGGEPDPHERAVRILKEHSGKSDGAGRMFDACLGGFSAARELGLDFVTGAPVHILSRDVSDSLLHRLGLRPVEAGSPFDLIVRRPPFPEAVFRAAVEAPSGVRAADAIQCWLDVRAHPARGAELADELWRHMGLEHAS